MKTINPFELDELDRKYPTSAGARRLTFLFNRKVAAKIHRDAKHGNVDVALMIMNVVLGGANARYCFDMLQSIFHPNKEVQWQAHQRLVDDLGRFFRKKKIAYIRDQSLWSTKSLTVKPKKVENEGRKWRTNMGIDC